MVYFATPSSEPWNDPHCHLLAPSDWKLTKKKTWNEFVQRPQLDGYWRLRDPLTQSSLVTGTHDEIQMGIKGTRLRVQNQFRARKKCHASLENIQADPQ
jgi:hypothetical protein